MTSVVVRTTANNAAGAKSKMSAIIHGVLLLVSVLAIPQFESNTISNFGCRTTSSWL
jgi:MFS superfamily sulfate permease-like transporter